MGLITCLMYWSLSAENEDYSTLAATINTHANFIIGERPDPLEGGGHPGVNTILHIFVTFFFMLVLINMLLAIVVDAYAKEVMLVEGIPVEYSLFYDIWLSVLDTWRFRWSNKKK